jgi:hypothetical protein
MYSSLVGFFEILNTLLQSFIVLLNSSLTFIEIPKIVMLIKFFIIK